MRYSQHEWRQLDIKSGEELDKRAQRIRWVNCEICGGTGEVVRLEPGTPNAQDEYSELCQACEGTGWDCVE